MIIYKVDPIKRTTRRGKQVSSIMKDNFRRGKVRRTSEEDNRVQDENEVSIDSGVCTTRLGVPIRGATYRVSRLKREVAKVCAYRITATNNA